MSKKIFFLNFSHYSTIESPDFEVISDDQKINLNSNDRIFLNLTPVFYQIGYFFPGMSGETAPGNGVPDYLLLEKLIESDDPAPPPLREKSCWEITSRDKDKNILSDIPFHRSLNNERKDVATFFLTRYSKNINEYVLTVGLLERPFTFLYLLMNLLIRTYDSLEKKFYINSPGELKHLLLEQKSYKT